MYPVGGQKGDTGSPESSLALLERAQGLNDWRMAPSLPLDRERSRAADS